MTTVGWGVRIMGESMDFEAWAYALKERFDYWVERHDSKIVLRSDSLDELTASIEVRDKAIAIIDLLNGAMALAHQTKPVHFGGLIEFKDDGSWNETQFIEPALIEGRSHFYPPTVALTGPDGQPVPPPPPQSSDVQRWAMLGDDWLKDALIYFGKANNWFDVYKAFECLEKKFGPTPRQFIALDWAPEADIELFKWTANWVDRHAKRKFKRPPKPMELREARQFVGQLLRRAYEEAAKNL